MTDEDARPVGDAFAPTEDSGDDARLRERLKRRLFEPTRATLRDEGIEVDTEDSPAPLETLMLRLFGGSLDPHRSESVIARGGMGIIERVRDRRLHRTAAMKIVRKKLDDTPWASRAFIAEAQVTAQLEHPNIVPVHSLGQLDDGRLYFTMKHVEGRTLGQLIKALPEGPISRADLFMLLEVIVKVCDALALAHSRHVFHCDLKPSNVMVGDYGEVYLMDWGIARVAETGPGAGIDTSVKYQHASTPFGTPAYMPPEQARGEPNDVDARTDVFGVGCLLYAILARRRPYPQKGMIAVVRAAAAADIEPLSAIAPAGSIPRELDRIVTKALSRDKADRFQSAAELRGALVSFMRGEQSFPRETHPAGSTIVREGDPGETAYIIESGSCRVTKMQDGADVVLRTMTAGDVFGETAVLANAPRTATVTAVEDTVVHVVSREAFEDALSAMSPWMAAFVWTLAERFRDRETTG